MFSLNLKSRQAIFEQIVTQVEDHILSGLLKPGDTMPSVRGLALELTINPNTVARAYLELEHRGIICTIVGKKTLVAPDALQVLAARLSLDELRQYVSKYHAACIPKEVLIGVINEVYEKNEDQPE